MERPEKTKIPLDEGAACDTCGRFGAMEIGDRHLCLACYEASGSCCPEFGKDDLWKAREELNEAKES